MMWTDDPLRDFDTWDAENAKWLAERPTCAWCGEPITDDTAYNLGGGEIVCRTCMKDCEISI